MLDGKKEKEAYRSSNGDRWFLVQGRGSEPMLVRHQPNRASGGQSSLIDVKDFLSEGHADIDNERIGGVLGSMAISFGSERATA
jgi:hypothetical protein